VSMFTKSRKSLFLVFILLTLFGVSSASASQLIPPTPSWWPTSGFDMRPGVWIACNEGKWNVDYCVESIDIRSNDGGSWKPLTFSANPDYSPESTIPIPWDGGGNDSAHLPQKDSTGPGYDGTWNAPTGIVTNNENLPLVMDMGFFGSPQGSGNYYSWVQFNLRTTKWDVSLSDAYQYRVKIKSKFLSAYARWTYANAADAAVDWSNPGYLIFTSTPSLNYYPSQNWDMTCAGKIDNSKAAYQVNIISLFLSVFGNNKFQNPPSQVMARTNAFMCNVTMNFDSSRNLLTMKPASVQLDSNGNQIVGWLETSIDANALRTWWQLDPKTTRGQVKVEVTYLDGKKESVATTAIYDSKTDRLRINSSGFHFPNSEVTINVSPCNCTGDVSGAFLDPSGTWSAFNDPNKSKVVVTTLKNGSRTISTNFGVSYANRHYSLSIMEFLKGKKVQTKLNNYVFDAKGRGTAILKNRLVAGSIVLASSGTRTAVSDPVT